MRVSLPTAAAIFSCVANAHMIMVTPTPFNKDTIDNSPLSSSGSDFPCKSTGKVDFYNAKGISNTMAIGSTQTLSFKGSAHHSGGSCQLALTKDKAPTPSTTWMVIHSIEGGCPSKSGSAPDTYDYTIPTGIEPGDYVFAWTWISKLAGQPEFYMNCAPVTVTAGSKKRSSRSLIKRNTFPNLFVANLQNVNSCKTIPGTDPVYPNPGSSVDRPGSSPKYATVSDNCLPLGASGGGSSGGSSSNGSTSTPSSSAYGAVTSTAVATSTAVTSTPATSTAVTSTPVMSTVATSTPISTPSIIIPSISIPKSSTTVSVTSTPSSSTASSGYGSPSSATATKSLAVSSLPAATYGYSSPSPSIAAPSAPSSTSDASPASSSSSPGSAYTSSLSTAAPTASPSASPSTSDVGSASSSSNPSSPSSVYASSSAAAASTTAPTTSPSTSDVGSVSSSASSLNGPSSAYAASSAVPTPSAAPSVSGPPGNGTTSASGSLSGACSREGMWNCIGGNSFQRCASGSWSGVVQLPGTSCTPGQSTSFAGYGN